jgi:hypothetical protein
MAREAQVVEEDGSDGGDVTRRHGQERSGGGTLCRTASPGSPSSLGFLWAGPRPHCRTEHAALQL